MATLTSTLKLESTDLFPTPVSFTVVNNNAISGDFSGFAFQQVTSTAVALNGPSAGITGMFVYVQAASTNVFPVYVGGTATTVVTIPNAKLYPGDVAFFPYGRSTVGNSISAICASGETGNINYFIGERQS